jgi:hypothetical protein
VSEGADAFASTKKQAPNIKQISKSKFQTSVSYLEVDFCLRFGAWDL